VTEPGESSLHRENPQAHWRRFRPDDREELLAFRRAAYGPASFQADPRYLAWSLLEPGASPASPELWIYRDRKIAAQVATHPVQVRIGAGERPGSWLSDIVVDPRARRLGIGSTLIEKAAAEAPVAMLIEATDDARGMLRRRGWTDLGDVPLHVRPLDAAFLRARVGDRFRGAALPAAAALRGLEAFWDVALRTAGVFLREVPAFDERSDALWDATGGAYDVLTRRDRRYLAWRFSAYPLRDRYRLYYLVRGNDPVGYAVLRSEARDHLRVGHLVDFLCARSYTPFLLAAVAATLRREGAHVAYCLCASPLSTAVFAAAGFLRRASSWPLLVDARRLPPAERALAADAGRWFVTAGDSNVDRPRENTVYAAALADAATTGE
jgi:GNAT superfamily N-acetyltransferase